MALSRIERAADRLCEIFDCWFVDVIGARAVSNHIAERFDEFHESPQALVIVDGECAAAFSHMEITPDALLAVAAHASQQA